MVVMSHNNEYFSVQENELNDLFLEKGYVLGEVQNMDALEKIRKTVVDLATMYLGQSQPDYEGTLDQIHTNIHLINLNDMRLNIIQQLNEISWLRVEYFKLARYMLETIVGNELAMQLRINLSIQLPEDDSSLLPVHADVWSGDSPFEAVVWLPLVKCYGTKSMFLLPPEHARELSKRFDDFKGKGSEYLFQAIRDDLTWIDIDYGQVLIFNQNLPHGNRTNRERETRWSLNCRFKSVFSPYGDKKLGEFFEPITLRATSRIGMDYRYPGVQD